MSFRPSLKHIYNLHFGKICMNAKFLTEISVNDFNMTKINFRDDFWQIFQFSNFWKK